MSANSTSAENIARLFKKWKGVAPCRIVKQQPSGSDRIYYRLYYGQDTVIGAYNPNISENIAFIEFTRHFNDHGLPVPSLLAANDPPDSYLITDLGDTTLFSLLPHQLQQVEFPKHVINIYKKALEWLPKIQVVAGKDLDYDVCYPRKAFDKQSMLWDLNYFKYFFLKLGGIHFDEQKLEDDFGKLVKWLCEAKADFFMFRDFQSRNIMIVDNEPCFIDYQGGRKGPLQYDVASLLFDAKANVPHGLREELLNHYLEQLRNYIDIDYDSFIEYYYGFALIRILQAMGAYGFRGFHEKKPLFLQSIPYAQNNLARLIDQKKFPENIPQLKDVAEQIINAGHFERFSRADEQHSGLKITIRSFSYKKGIPVDLSGNGGGFVFDCRALPNPGRLEKFKSKSGRDRAVIEYLEEKPEVKGFMDMTSKLVMASAKNYIERGFTNLMVCYGCTGGQHRSVYCAEKLAEQLKKKLNVEINLQHEEENITF